MRTLTPLGVRAVMKPLRIDNGTPLVSVVLTTESNYMDNQDDLKTQPTATAIMERLQSMEARLLEKIDSLAIRTEQELASLKAELTAHFTHLAAKVQVLNEDTLDVRGGQREILKRIRELEEKVKAS